MNIDGVLTRRRFLRYASVGGIAVPMFATTVLPNVAPASVFQLPADPENLTDMEKLHIPKITLPPVVEDGSQAPIVVEVDHPMEPDHYIKNIQIMNFNDPVVIKGKFYFTPANGEVYLGTQIRLDGGEPRVWVVAECNKHGKWAGSKDTKVAAGGC
ncbi:MAG: twin-arginine translocation signal domain-containing protein [Proteobacteria bacterium]|nr:twin-arginine translocation signal domain-containing protein [Pseudomonadota bacterium]